MSDKKCPACDVEAAVMGPLAAFVFGATMGRVAASQDAPLASLCCTPHRRQIVRAQLATLAELAAS